MLRDQYRHPSITGWTKQIESRVRQREVSIMKIVTHNCSTEAGEVAKDESIEEIAESVEELREQLANMKRLMEEKKDITLGEISRGRRRRNSNIIDGNFLSWVFGLALIVILSVSVYAFYSLYDAVLRKFPSHHTEL